METDAVSWGYACLGLAESVQRLGWPLLAITPPAYMQTKSQLRHWLASSAARSAFCFFLVIFAVRHNAVTVIFEAPANTVMSWQYLFVCLCLSVCLAPCGLGSCRISQTRFLAECRKRRLNQASFVLLYFVLFVFLPRDALNAKRGLAIACRLSVCNVGGLRSHRLEFFRNNFTIS